MSTRLQVLCRPGTGAGFALAGLRPLEVPDPAAATQRLRELLRRDDPGVVLVEDTLHQALTPELRRRLARRPLPMIVPFPAPRWVPLPEGTEGYIADLLRQAIGYRVRLL